MIGDAVQSCGEYAEPAAQQNHARSGGGRICGPQDEDCHRGEACASSCCEVAMLFGRMDEPIIWFAPLFLSDLCRHRRACSNSPIAPQPPPWASLRGPGHVRQPPIPMEPH